MANNINKGREKAILTCLVGVWMLGNHPIRLVEIARFCGGPDSSWAHPTILRLLKKRFVAQEKGGFGYIVKDVEGLRGLLEDLAS